MSTYVRWADPRGVFNDPEDEPTAVYVTQRLIGTNSWQVLKMVLWSSDEVLATGLTQKAADGFIKLLKESK